MDTKDRLSDVLSEFARTLVTDFSIQGILDHLVRRVVDILPIEAAGVSLMSPSADPEFIAASDESAIRYEHLQVELGEGPCIAAYETDGPILIPDLAENERFPKYAERAMAEGLVAVFTFPLRHDRRSLGVLDLYRTTPGALDEEDIATARTLADVATAYLLNAEARQAKTDFVATVSHELRTPMTIITGFIELLQDGVTGPLNHDQEMFVKAIARNSDRLTGLANDLLTLTSVERGAINRQQVPVDLGQVISRVQATMAPLIAARHLDVAFEIPTTPVTVRGDSQELESLVTNLLSNAIKFTQDGGWVRCALQSDAQQASLKVSDNGLGIPEDEQGHLFSRFFRSSTAHQHAIQGSGLGLTIVESIVKRHGGDISLVSKHLAGSAFTVRLPLTLT